MRRGWCTLLLAVLTFGGAILQSGCGGVTGNVQGVAPTVAVVVSPSSVTLQTGATQQFAATVTGLSSSAVTWSATAGTITASGLYTAPSTPGTYTVSAQSTADSKQSGSATVTVTSAPPAVSVSVSPSTASVQPSQTKQFSATVSGTTNTAVTWTATGGTINSSGLYTAPASPGTYTVTATSAADTSKSATATVTVQAVATQILNASPTSLAFGNVLVGGTSTQTVTITNAGTASVTVTAANFTGGVFTAPGLTLPATIAPNTSVTVPVQFMPDVSGPFSGSVSVVSNATNSPATIAFSGTGLAPQPHSVDLSWTGSTSTNVVGYYIYRSTTSGGGYAKLNTSSVGSTTYTDSTVSSGTTYYYVVTAVDNNGNESAYSNQSTAMIPTP
jgi:hypothetical protein